MANAWQNFISQRLFFVSSTKLPIIKSIKDKNIFYFLSIQTGFDTRSSFNYFLFLSQTPNCALPSSVSISKLHGGSKVRLMSVFFPGNFISKAFFTPLVIASPMGQ